MGRCPVSGTAAWMHATPFIAALIVLVAAAVHVVPLVGEAQQAANIPQ
jgi:hypothetical protein